MKAAMFFLVGSLALAMSASANAQNTDLGEELYTSSCALCHGASGEGDGSFVQYLTVPPANLTTLAKDNDGVFPYIAIYEVVDGRAMVSGHGESEMPIWGTVFERELVSLENQLDVELLVRARIVALVDYVRSLQVE